MLVFYERKESFMDLAQKIAKVLGAEEPPEEPHLPVLSRIPDEAVIVGYVPEHLKRLHTLCATLAEEQHAERRRRHEQVFPGRSSGHEGLEYMIDQELAQDARFGGTEIVRALFGWSLKAHIRNIPLDGLGLPEFALGPNWEVYAVEKRNAHTPTPRLPTDVILTQT